MNWIKEFEFKRKSQRSNVFLFETSDPKRIEEFSRHLEQITFDIQRGRLLDKDDRPMELDLSETVLQNLDSMLCSDQVNVLVRTVFNRSHADHLADYLMAWSQDNHLFSNSSTVAVFTTDLTLFPNALLNMSCSMRIPASSAEEREGFVKKLEEQINRTTDRKMTIPDTVIEASAGLTLHEIETSTLESIYKSGEIQTETFTEFKINKLQNFGLQYIVPTRGFESVGGYGYLKEYIRRRVIRIIHSPEIARKYGVCVPKGILLFGPPGTGKTWFAKALSKEIGLPMITLSPADFLRGIVGESEARVRQVISLINSLSPIVIFIDEFDQLALSRDRQIAGGGEVLRGVQNTLLEWLGDEKRTAFVIGASNFISQLDPAFIRAGRIDDIVLFLYPDQDAREEILKIHTTVLRKIPVKNLDYKQVTDDTYMFNAAELEKLVSEAAASAMDANSKHVDMSHVAKALGGIDINVAEREKTVKEMISKMKKLENVNQQFLSECFNDFRSSVPKSRVDVFREVDRE